MKNIKLDTTLANLNTHFEGIEGCGVGYATSEQKILLYVPVPHDYSQDYFTIESLADDNHFTDGFVLTDCYYKLPGSEEWGDMMTVGSFDLNAGEKALVKASGSSGGPIIFNTSNKPFKVYGNIMSLVYGDNFTGQTAIPNDRIFMQALSGCTALVDAKDLVLPATTLATSCYNGMFSGCTSLTTAPALPATTLATSCYAYMFNECSSLTIAPELPAATLTNYCYRYMFSHCTSLNYIKCLATDISASNCTQGWVGGTASSGTFVKAASMEDWSTGNAGIPTDWTVQNA